MDLTANKTASVASFSPVKVSKSVITQKFTFGIVLFSNQKKTSTIVSCDISFYNLPLWKYFNSSSSVVVSNVCMRSGLA
jgi:hypothetical protein